MLNPSHILAASFFLVFPHVVNTALAADKFSSGTPYYFNDFDPGKQPWEPGQFLNFEEVFKNYQYYEIIFDQDGKGFTVNRYVSGSKENSEKYFIMPDNSLRKK